MAINYTKIGWDTSKYVNPTNMNQMDDGIKAACDGVDAHASAITNLNTAVGGRVKLTSATTQTVERSSGGGEAALALKSNTTVSALRLLDASGTFLGDIGVNASRKPYFDDGTKKEIALKEDFGPFNSSGILRFNSVLYRNAAGARVFNYTIPTTKTPTIVAILDEGSDTDIKANFTISNSAGTIYLYTWSGAYDGHVLHITFKCE